MADIWSFPSERLYLTINKIKHCNGYRGLTDGEFNTKSVSSEAQLNYKTQFRKRVYEFGKNLKNVISQHNIGWLLNLWL